MEVNSFFSSLGAWNWLIIAVVFLGLELAAPGIYFVWFGIAAAIVGGIALTNDIGWQWQFITFAILSIASAVAARSYMRRNPTESDRPLLNKRAQQYVGRLYTLAEPIEGGRGKVRIGDTLWQVEGPDMPIGAQVKVTGADGTVLKVGMPDVLVNGSGNIDPARA